MIKKYFRKKKQKLSNNQLWKLYSCSMTCHTLFVISAETSKIRQLLKDAMAEWERYTCIRFEERVNQSDYVEFYYGEGYMFSLFTINSGKHQCCMTVWGKVSDSIQNWVITLCATLFLLRLPCLSKTEAKEKLSSSCYQTNDLRNVTAQLKGDKRRIIEGIAFASHLCCSCNPSPGWNRIHYIHNY